MKFLNYLLVLPLFILSVSAQQPAYKNPALPAEKRVADLLKRMTLEEKVAQLQSAYPARPKLTKEFLADPRKMDSLFGRGLGMINFNFEDTMEQTIAWRNELQHYLRTKTRLGIPVIFLDEAHHGLVHRKADIFPQAIGMSCSWDTALVRSVYSFTGRQASSRGTNMVLAPVVDVVRDPRWGRTGECLGEDPFLAGMLGSAQVKGLQGASNGQVAPDHVGATLKHFTGHGQPEAGNNQAPANYSVRALREFHMESFRLVVGNAKPTGIMASYSEVGEIPSHSNKWLLTDVLRKEWNYKGVVVSDWFGIDHLWKKHFVSATEKDAAADAFNAGVTVDLPYGINYRHLVACAKEGKISVKDLDSAVVKILRLKFQLGLFERKEIDLKKAYVLTNTAEGRELALKAAERSIVLLKNNTSGGTPLLPIRKDQFKKIAVIGPCAAVNYLGDYSGVPVKNVSILEGIRNKLGGQAEVLYAKGVHLTKNGDTISQNNLQFIDTLILPAREENLQLIDEAVEVARQSEFVVLCIGENEQFCRESWPLSHFGDITDLNLQSHQEELVKAVVATGKPVVVYLMHGRPLTIPWIAENVPAIVDGWYMGEEAGNAFANVLFGDVNPSGKLTMTYPRSTGQVPVFYNHKPSAQFYEYVTEKNKPLFPFGYGLSYTTYSYAKPILSGRTLTVEVTNTGKMKGEEIVQLYIRDKVSTVVRPVKELKGFLKITLNPGETRQVSFAIPDELLKSWSARMIREVEPGAFDILVGSNSDDLQKVELIVPR